MASNLSVMPVKVQRGGSLMVSMNRQTNHPVERL